MGGDGRAVGCRRYFDFVDRSTGSSIELTTKKNMGLSSSDDSRVLVIDVKLFREWFEIGYRYGITIHRSSDGCCLYPKSRVARPHFPAMSGCNCMRSSCASPCVSAPPHTGTASPFHAQLSVFQTSPCPMPIPMPCSTFTLPSKSAKSVFIPSSHVSTWVLVVACVCASLVCASGTPRPKPKSSTSPIPPSLLLKSIP